MRKQRVLHTRVTSSQLAKVAAIRAATGLNTSQLLAKLVDAAQVEPTQGSIVLATNSKGDGIRQDNSVAFAA